MLPVQDRKLHDLTPPADLPDYDQFPELPDEIPDWVLLDPVIREVPRCECCGQWRHDDVDEGLLVEPVEWAIPGVTGVAARLAEPALPGPSPKVLALEAAVAALETVDAQLLPSGQALVDAQLLLQLEQRLRVQDLRRIADVKGRALHDLAGYRSTKSWLKAQRPDGDSTDADLASQLRGFRVLSDAVRRHTVPLVSAREVATMLRRCIPHLDRRDGLIYGQPGEQVMEAVLRHVVTLVCRDLQGLHDDDPRLAVLLAQARSLAEQGDGRSQAPRLEAALTWLAEQLPPRGWRGRWRS